MNEDESISDFNIRLHDTANTYILLGEKMFKKNMVRKILRSLPKKFDMKVITIEEAQDLSNIKVDESIGSLQTFEMTLSDRFEKKNKRIDFMSNTEEDKYQGEESLSGVIALVGRKVNKVLRRLDINWRTNVQKKVSNISYMRKSKDDHKPNKGK